MKERTSRAIAWLLIVIITALRRVHEGVWMDAFMETDPSAPWQDDSWNEWGSCPGPQHPDEYNNVDKLKFIGIFIRESMWFVRFYITHPICSRFGHLWSPVWIDQDEGPSYDECRRCSSRSHPGTDEDMYDKEFSLLLD